MCLLAIEEPQETDSTSLQNRIANSATASAAAITTAAVNNAVSMRTLEAPSLSKSYIGEYSGAVRSEAMS